MPSWRLPPLWGTVSANRGYACGGLGLQPLVVSGALRHKLKAVPSAMRARSSVRAAVVCERFPELIRWRDASVVIFEPDLKDIFNVPAGDRRVAIEDAALGKESRKPILIGAVTCHLLLDLVTEDLKICR